MPHEVCYRALLSIFCCSRLEATHLTRRSAARRGAPRLSTTPYRGPRSPLQHVDAFVCNHPPALCELYMPFNKSLLVLAFHRFSFAVDHRVRRDDALLRRVRLDDLELDGVHRLPY